MNSRRDYRSSRSALFDGVEEGGLRAFSSYSTHEISEIDNDRAIDGLHDRVNLLKRLTGDIHEEVESHNKILNRMGNSMDISRGVLSVTMDRFRMVFQAKSTRRMTSLVVFFVVPLLTRILFDKIGPYMQFLPVEKKKGKHNKCAHFLPENCNYDR